MGSRTAFFYGSLMAPEVLYRVIYRNSYPSQEKKDLLKIRPAILHGYCRHRVKHASYPAIVESAGDSVRGTLVTGLSNVAIERLDRFEGSQYDRGNVKVKVLAQAGDDAGHGNVEADEVEAEAYIWGDDPDDLEHREWDFAEFKRTHMRAWIDPPPRGTAGSEETDQEELESEMLEEEEFDSVVSEDEDDDEKASESAADLEDDEEEAPESDAEPEEDAESESGVTHEDDAPDGESVASEGSGGPGDDAPSKGAAISKPKV